MRTRHAISPLGNIRSVCLLHCNRPDAGSLRQHARRKAPAPPCTAPTPPWAVQRLKAFRFPVAARVLLLARPTWLARLGPKSLIQLSRAWRIMKMLRSVKMRPAAAPSRMAAALYRLWAWVSNAPAALCAVRMPGTWSAPHRLHRRLPTTCGCMTCGPHRMA